MSVEYKSVTVYREKDRVVVETDTNTLKFFGCSMEEIAVFVRKLIEE